MSYTTCERRGWDAPCSELGELEAALAKARRESEKQRADQECVAGWWREAKARCDALTDLAGPHVRGRWAAYGDDFADLPERAVTRRNVDSTEPAPPSGAPRRTGSLTPRPDPPSSPS